MFILFMLLYASRSSLALGRSSTSEPWVPCWSSKSKTSSTFSNIDTTYSSKSDVWSSIESKSCTEQGATSLRKDQQFAGKVYESLKSLN